MHDGFRGGYCTSNHGVTLREVAKVRVLCSRMFVLFTLVLTILIAWGCAYHLDYTLSARRRPGTLPAGDMTFRVEPDPEHEKVRPRTRERMLLTLKQSLIEAGWEEAEHPAYVFTLDFEKMRDPYADGVRVGFFFGTGGSGFSALFGMGRRDRYERFLITVTANSPELGRAYVWSAEMDTGPVAQNPAALARHMIPDAVSRFPEEGFWEIKKRVDLHG